MKNKILNLSKKLISVGSTKERPENLKKVLEVVEKELKGFKVKRFNKNNCPSLLFVHKPMPTKIVLGRKSRCLIFSVDKDGFVKMRGSWIIVFCKLNFLQSSLRSEDSLGLMWFNFRLGSLSFW